MRPNDSNLVLVGMPGAGKSTVGVLLAKRTSKGFVDTDVLIQTTQGRTLQQIVDADGYRQLRRIEESVLLGLSLHNHVIATGGSAVYSAPAIEHLKSGGPVVFLHVEPSILRKRLPDLATRGLAAKPGQAFADLYRERLPLYARCADITVNCGKFDQDGVCARILDALRSADRRA